MKIIVLFLIAVSSLFSNDLNFTPIDGWNHASGNDHNFDLWAVSPISDALWHADLKEGKMRKVGDLGVDIKFAGLCFDKDHNLIMLFSNSKRLRMAVIDRSTGKATVTHDFGRFRDMTIGFEISRNGKDYYWSNRNVLRKLDLEMSTVTRVMKLEMGSWCLANSSGGTLLAVGTNDKKLYDIDIKKQKIKVIKDFGGVAPMPAMASTPGGRLYVGSRDYKFYGVDDGLSLMGTLDDRFIGFAISNKSVKTSKTAKTPKTTDAYLGDS